MVKLNKHWRLDLPTPKGKINHKLFLTYRDLTYVKLQKDIEKVNNITGNKRTPGHITAILQKCEEWLKSEVAKQPVESLGKEIIEDASNIAAVAWCRVNGIRLAGNKTPEDVVSMAENFINSAHIFQNKG